MRKGRTGLAAALAVTSTAVALAGGELDRVCPSNCRADDAKATSAEATRLDAGEVFEALVARYRGLADYHESTQLTQITRRPGASEQRQETRLECDIRSDDLVVTTPGEQVRQGLGLALPLRSSEAMEEFRRRYELWLVPHMTLRFCDEPLADFREGVEEGFTPCLAERIVRNKRSMVHLKLRSGDGLSAVCEAEFDFYINVESMLIERIEGIEHLPDGSDLITTLEITPRATAATVS